MRYRRLLSLLAILSLLISLTIALPIVHGDGSEDFTVPEKQPLQYPNLGSHLSQIAAAVEAGNLSAEQAATDSPIHSGGSVAVTIHLSGNVDDVVDFLVINGGDPRNVGEDYIEAYAPLTLLGQLSEQPGVIRVREIFPPEPDYGPITSQGVQAHLVQPWHDAGYSGQEIKVGIIDSGFEGFSQLIGTELTAVAGVRCYSDIGVFSQSLADCEGEDVSVHGTAVAETVIDIAPQVTLYIADPYSQGDVNDIVDWMVSEGVSVINQSLSWPFTGPGDGTSPFGWSVLNAVDHAADGGITWANSAGNRTRQTWFNSGPFSDTDGDGLIDFDGSDESNGFELEEDESALIQLRWEGNWGGASSDLNFYVVEQTTGQLVQVGIDHQTGGPGDIPYEIASFAAPRDGVYEVFVEHASGSAPAWIQLMVWDVRLEHSTANVSITSPGESANPGLLTVGATHYWDTHTIASYSSQGPAPDGRIKPDIVGTACAETVSYQPREGSRCWFGGTSQASPHVAGLAALVKQRFPDFTPDQVAERGMYRLKLAINEPWEGAGESGILVLLTRPEAGGPPCAFPEKRTRFSRLLKRIYLTSPGHN